MPLRPISSVQYALIKARLFEVVGCRKRWVSMHTEGRRTQCSGRLFEVIGAATLKLRWLSSVDVFDMVISTV